ncbi:MAG: ribosome-associated translation inhibitor RaiA [Anaerolineae bacterium]|nr:ribosome-associated translation inhibitor RaiA [Anaerolineae bacterium]
MEVNIYTRDIELTDQLQEYIETKVNKLDRYLPGIDEARLELSKEHRKKTGAYPVAQLTIRHRRGRILRAEDKRQTDVRTAIDSVLDKMYRQIRSFKGKRQRRGRAEEMDWFEGAEPLPEAEAAMEEEPKMEIVRRKPIPLIPIDEQEAMERIEEVGHDFYMFLNANTGKVSVLYRREEGNYGLLEPSDV